VANRERQDEAVETEKLQEDEQEPKETERAREARGFAAMTQEKQRAIASKGGKAAHQKGTAHEFTRDEARAAGRKGGEAISGNRDHMATIGRKGGETVSQNREHMAAIGRKGGEAVSSDRLHMSAIGRKGGESRGEQRPRPPASAVEREQAPVEGEEMHVEPQRKAG
jgi:general stress protein YciG